jgi:cellulose biosynthesis protein BcsQ
MKGGVGKTTVAMSFAEGSAFLGRRTLVIDLDLQLNASMTLVSDRDGNEPWKRNKTVEDYFQGRRTGTRVKAMSLIEHIDHNVHLLSGKLSLVLFERELLTRSNAVFAASNHISTWLGDLIKEVKPNYDLIIFDTPPGLSILAECSIKEAHLVVVPQAPDRLSTQGIEVYANYLTKYLDLKKVGQKTAVFINMQPSPITNVAKEHIKQIKEMAGKRDFPYRLFDTHYTMLDAFRGAMQRERPAAFDKLWKGVGDSVIAANRELWRFLGHPFGQQEAIRAVG